MARKAPVFNLIEVLTGQLDPQSKLKSYTGGLRMSDAPREHFFYAHATDFILTRRVSWSHATSVVVSRDRLRPPFQRAIRLVDRMPTEPLDAKVAKMLGVSLH